MTQGPPGSRGIQHRRRTTPSCVRELRARCENLLLGASARIDGYPAWLSSLFVFVTLLGLYLLTASREILQSPDPLAAAIPAWNFAVHGNFNLDAFEGLLRWFVPGRDHIVSDRNPGVIFFGIPFYWVFSWFSEEQSVIPAAIASGTAAAGAITVLHILFRRFVAPSTAMFAALIAGLGTSTWSVSANGLWPHGINQLLFASTLFFLARERWVASGAFLGLAIFTRPQTAFASAALGLYTSWRQRSIKPVAVIGVLSFAALAALLAYNTRMFGAPRLTGGYVHDPYAFALSLGPLGYLEALAGTLVSPDRGILVLSPFLLVLAPGLPAAWRVAPPWVRSGAWAGLTYILVHLALNRFSGGDNFFSYRIPIEFLTLTAPLGLLAWKEWASRDLRRKQVFTGLATLSILIHALGTIYWSPTFDERSPWANFKLLEAIQSAGWWALPTGGVVILGGLVLSLGLGHSRPAEAME